MGCGVCGTPELWRGAADLCAVPPNLYIHTSYNTSAPSSPLFFLYTRAQTSHFPGHRSQSINQSKVLTKPHAGKEEAISQHHHRGQQTLHHEMMQASVSDGRKPCVTTCHEVTASRTVCSPSRWSLGRLCRRRCAAGDCATAPALSW